MQTAIVIALMAGITYLLRFIPFGIFTKQIKSNFLQSFFYYIPCATLSAMTFPAIFYSTNNVFAGVTATLVALYLAYTKKNLIEIAIASVVVSFLVMLVI